MPEAAPRRVLVLDFGGSTPAVGRATGAIAANVLEERARFDVVSAADLRAVLDREASLQDAGCDAMSESCLANLADAMGASIVLHGAVTPLGSRYLVSVTLFDADAGRSLARKLEEVGSEEEIAGATRRITRAIADDLNPPTPSSPLLTVGGWTLGVGAVAAALGLGGAAYASIIEADPKSDGGAKSTALFWHVPASVVGISGAVVAVVGAGALTIGLLGGE